VDHAGLISAVTWGTPNFHLLGITLQDAWHPADAKKVT
jgi:hypothetical protein